MYRIVKVIEEICKKLNISYQSPRHKLLDQFNEDVRTLVDIYTQLKQIGATLTDIENRYQNLNGLKDIFERIINELDKIDHDIIREAYKLRNKHKHDNRTK